jgi:nucleoside phosphorylase
VKKAFIIALGEEVNHVATINGAMVLYSGVGKINATIGAYTLIQQGATEIINVGSCGSTQHKLGEIIKVGKVFQDIDGTPISPYGHTPFEAESHCITLDELSPFSCFTTDYFFDHSQHSKYAPAYLEMIKSCSVFDMELYAIAKTCLRHGVGLSSYKWVSDDGDFSKWKENCEISSQKVIEMLS